MKQLFSNIFGEGYQRRILAKRELSSVLLGLLAETLFLGFWIATALAGFRTIDFVFVALMTVVVFRDGKLVYGQVSQVIG